MSYIPKSQIKYITVNGELVDKQTKRPYHGSAIQTSKNKFYAGSNNIVPGPELIKREEISDKVERENHLIGITPGDKFFSFDYSTRKFNKLNPKSKKKINNKRSLASSKPRPTKQDYGRGKFIRYFGRRINGNNYIEINKSSYEDIVNKKGYHDPNLYVVGSLPWYIRGNDVHRLNSISIKRSQIAHS